MGCIIVARWPAGSVALCPNQGRLVEDLEDSAIVTALTGTREVEIMHDKPHATQNQDEARDARNS